MSEGEKSTANYTPEDNKLAELIKTLDKADPRRLLQNAQKQEVANLILSFEFSHFQSQYLLLIIQSFLLNRSYSKDPVINPDCINEFSGKIFYMINRGLNTEFDRLVRIRATQVATSYYLLQYGNFIQKFKIRLLDIIQPESSGLHFYNPNDNESRRILERTDGRYFSAEEFIKVVSDTLVEAANNRPASLGLGLFGYLENKFKNLKSNIDMDKKTPREVQDFAILWKTMSEENLLKMFGFSKEQVTKILQLLEKQEGEVR